jgi:hypothetical protein
MHVQMHVQMQVQMSNPSLLIPSLVYALPGGLQLLQTSNMDGEFGGARTELVSTLDILYSTRWHMSNGRYSDAKLTVTMTQKSSKQKASTGEANTTATRGGR